MYKYKVSGIIHYIKIFGIIYLRHKQSFPTVGVCSYCNGSYTNKIFRRLCQILTCIVALKKLVQVVNLILEDDVSY